MTMKSFFACADGPAGISILKIRVSKFRRQWTCQRCLVMVGRLVGFHPGGEFHFPATGEVKRCMASGCGRSVLFCAGFHQLPADFTGEFRDGRSSVNQAGQSACHGYGNFTLHLVFGRFLPVHGRLVDSMESMGRKPRRLPCGEHVLPGCQRNSTLAVIGKIEDSKVQGWRRHFLPCIQFVSIPWRGWPN